MSEAKEFLLEEKVVREVSLSRGEPDWLTETRMKSFSSFTNLPAEKSPLYIKYADFKGVSLESLDPLAFRKTSEGEVKDLEDSLMAEGRPFVIQAGPSLTRAFIPEQLMEEGLYAGELITSVKERPELLESRLKNPAVSSEEDKVAAMNNALFNLGLFIYFPKGLEVKVPLRVFTLVPHSSNVVSQLFLVLDEGSRATVIQEYRSSPGEDGSRPSLYSENTHIHLGLGSWLRFAGIQALDTKTPFFANRRAVCQRDSSVNWAFGFFGGLLTRSRVDSYLEGAGSSAEDLEVVFGSESQRFDVVSDLTHKGPHTKGVNLSRGVLKDKSRSVFKGMIRISTGAKNAEAYLAEHVMLLNRDAKSNAIPGLEIQTNEVRATHSASVAQIDEEQIFYLMSRGLSQEEAKKMIVQGFFQPVAERIPLPEVRRNIRSLVEEKWGGKREDFEAIDFEEEAPEAGKGVEELFARHYKYR